MIQKTAMPIVSLLRFGTAIQHQPITLDAQGKLKVPNNVIIPVIEGDGIGPEIMHNAKRVVEKAIEIASKLNGVSRSIQWLPLIMGEKALAAGKKLIPDETVAALKQHFVMVKGPLNTPPEGGFRSVNVELRKIFDLFACVRPVTNIPGVVSPMKEDKTNVVIFRENVEDVYKGIEFEMGSPLAKVLIFLLNKVFPLLNKVLNKVFGSDVQYVADIREDSAIGIKPISQFNSKRLIRSAIQYAIEHNRPSVTLVGKANIMKFTEGAFFKWGREVAQQEFPNQTILYDDFKKQYNADFNTLPVDPKTGRKPVVIQDRLTDAMFQDVILNPEWHSVVATMNLNGDYLSDSFAATVGGLGIAPGANIGDPYAVFESTHGSAPNIVGQKRANPTALLLTMAMMLDHLGWKDAAQLVRKGVEKTLSKGIMTPDLAEKAKLPGVNTDEYTEAVVQAMEDEGQPLKHKPAA